MGFNSAFKGLIEVFKMRVTYLYDWQCDGGVQVAKWSSLYHCAVCIKYCKNQ